jgi:predicted nuclease with TOPRIM domain
MPAYISSSMPSAMPSGQAASNPAAGTAPAGMTMGAAGKPVSIIDMIPAQVRNKIPSNVLAQLKDVKTPQDLKKKITELEKAISTLEAKISETSKSQEKMKTAISSIQAAREDMKDTINKMTTLKSAVPGAFTTAKNNYIEQIDQNSDKLEKTYQSTLNTGFKQIYMTSAISALIALVILFLYKDKRNAKNTLSQSAA